MTIIVPLVYDGNGEIEQLQSGNKLDPSTLPIATTTTTGTIKPDGTTITTNSTGLTSGTGFTYTDSTITGNGTTASPLSVSTEVNSLTSSISTLNTKYTNLSSTVSNNTSSISTLNTEYTSLSSTVSTLTSIPTGTTTATPNTLMLRNTNANVQVNNLTQNLSIVSQSSQTVRMTAASSNLQYTHGTAGMQYFLPDATTLAVGTQYVFINRDTNINNVGISDYTDNVFYNQLAANGYTIFTCIGNSTQTGSWDYQLFNSRGGSSTLPDGTSSLGGSGYLADTGHIHPRSRSTFYATLASNQNTGLTVGSPVQFASSTFSGEPIGAGIPVITLSSYQFTLPTGFKYEFEFGLYPAFTATNGLLVAQMYNVTAGAIVTTGLRAITFGSTYNTYTAYVPVGCQEITNTSGSNIIAQQILHQSALALRPH